MNTENDMKALFDAAQRLQAPQVVKLSEEASVLLVPTGNGIVAQDVSSYTDKYLAAPRRRNGTAQVLDLESFIDHVKRFSDGDSAIFADPNPEAPKLVAVLDYHRTGATGLPRFGEHRTVYDFPLSDEWKAWTEHDDQKLGQAEFAAFIEDRIADLANPDDAGDAARNLMLALDCTMAAPVRIMELSRGLSIRVGSKVVNAINLKSGEAQVNFETEHQDKDGQALKIPSAFLIQIPVFKNGPPYRIAARLRYRVQGTAIVWFYSLYRAKLTFQDAFKGACDEAEESTGLPLFVGRPE